MEEKNAPAIHFRGFNHNWEWHTVGELIEDYFEKTVINNQYPVLTSSQKQGVLLQEDYFADRQITTSDNIGYYVLPKGCFTYRSRSDTDLFVFNRNDIIDKGIISYYYPVFKPQNTDSDFLLIRLNHGIKRQLSMAAEGTGQHVLSHNKFKKTVLSVPLIEEQEKIGAVFKALDNLISRQQRKYEKFLNLKSAMLEKMFPKDGADVPEIRFAGFSGAWEQRRLSDLCIKFCDGDWIESKDQSDSGIRLIQTGNVGVAEFLNKPNNSKWISKVTFECLHCEEVFPGDILISRLPEPAGRACITPHLGSRMITAVDCTIARLAPDYNSKFLIQYLSSQVYFDMINTALAGGTRQRISRNNLANFHIPIPEKFEEQEVIGDFFMALDTLINSQQRELEKIKYVKKSMIDRMFV